ncbi:MAG: hypothetical protein HY887_01775 [Deltaproteobacteria bacterium]|nr:hypothetical protein [Deltaproteobacteria bacterium]
MRFFGKTPVAGLYAGPECAAVAEAQVLGGAWRLKRFVKAPMPDGASFSGLRSLIPALLSLSGIKARGMTIAIPDIAAKTFLLDEGFSNRDKLIERISSSDFNISLDGDRVEYQMLSNNGSRKALVSAVSADIIASIEDALVERGFRAIKISPASFNIANWISSRIKPMPQDFSIIVSHGDYFAAHFFRGGTLDFYRCRQFEEQSEAVRDMRAAFVHYMGRTEGWKAGKVFLLGGRAAIGRALSEWFGHDFEAVDLGSFFEQGGFSLDRHDALTALSALT